jgi:hypothetical protein
MTLQVREKVISSQNGSNCRHYVATTRRYFPLIDFFVIRQKDEFHCNLIVEHNGSHELLNPAKLTRIMKGPETRRRSG